MTSVWKVPGARIRRRGDSYQSDVTWEGQRFRKSFRRLSDATKWSLDSIVLLEAGSKPKVKSDDFGPKNFGELCDRAFEMLWSDGNNTSSVKVILGKLTEILPGNHRIITEIETDKLIRVLRKRGLSPRTINNYLNVLGKVLTFAVDRNWIRSKPKLRRERERGQERRHFSIDEVYKIRTYFSRYYGEPFAEGAKNGHRYRQLFDFMIDTGLRIGEALSLDWKDCQIEDDEGKTITVRMRKHPTSPVVTLPLTEHARGILRYIRDYCGGPMEDGPFGDLTYSRCRYAWDSLRKHYKIENDPGFVWHGTRHTFCSRLVQAGVSIAVVKELARHNDIKTTLGYAHLEPSNLREAILKLEDYESPADEDEPDSDGEEDS